MKFPHHKTASVATYCKGYVEVLERAFQSLDMDQMARAASALLKAFSQGKTVYVCGNGGSAAISNHLRCDFVKGVQTQTTLRPKVISLTGNLETLTAIANDMAYEEIFVYQLKTLAEPGDLLMTISSSGDSENIFRALDWAKKNSMTTIALCGFEGGRSLDLADIPLYVSGSNYGIVEDVHQSLMHMLAQYIRQSQMSEHEICEQYF